MISIREVERTLPVTITTRRRRTLRAATRGWRGSLLIGLVIGVLVFTGIWISPWGRTHIAREKSMPPEGVAAFFGPEFHPRSGGSFGLDRADVVRSTRTPFLYYLRVSYPPMSGSNLASATSEGVVVGGSQLYLKSNVGPTDHAFLRYFVRFPTGFDFVKGGKLPGLYGGKVTSGRKIPNGSDGLSTRYMWRTKGAGEVYAYLPTSQDHGTSLGRGDWSWPTGRWACVEQEVRLNDPGSDDGVVTVWLDDHRVSTQTGLTFRDRTSLQIDGLFFSTFFGGGDASWATPLQQHADFADFRMSATHIGCSGGAS